MKVQVVHLSEPPVVSVGVIGLSVAREVVIIGAAAVVAERVVIDVEVRGIRG